MSYIIIFHMSKKVISRLLLLKSNISVFLTEFEFKFMNICNKKITFLTGDFNIYRLNMTLEYYVKVQ